MEQPQNATPEAIAEERSFQFFQEIVFSLVDAAIEQEKMKLESQLRREEYEHKINLLDDKGLLQKERTDAEIDELIRQFEAEDLEKLENGTEKGTE